MRWAASAVRKEASWAALSQRLRAHSRSNSAAQCAETLCVGLLPALAARGVRVVGGKQGPGFGGQRGHGLGGQDASGIVSLNTGPESLLLEWREQHGRIRRVEGVIAEEVAQPGIPVEDGGRGPDADAGGALRFGKAKVESAGGARAGGDDGSAAPERVGDGPGQVHGESLIQCKLAGENDSGAHFHCFGHRRGSGGDCVFGRLPQRRQPGAAVRAPGQQAGVKQYNIRGVVVSSDAKTGQVTVDTQAIPGYMAAMTMPYTLRQPNIATELHPGDTITAVLTPTDDADYLDQIVVVAQAKPDYKPAVTLQRPGAGRDDSEFRISQPERSR